MSCIECPLRDACAALLASEETVFFEDVRAEEEVIRSNYENNVLRSLSLDTEDPTQEYLGPLIGMEQAGLELLRLKKDYFQPTKMNDMRIQELLCSGPVYSRRLIFFKGAVLACGSKRRREYVLGEET